MTSPLHSGVMRARQATACALVVACLLPVPTRADAPTAGAHPRVPASGGVSTVVGPAGEIGSFRGWHAPDGGYWFGNQAASPSFGPATSHIRRSLANLSDRAITPTDRTVAPDMQRSYRGRGRGRGRSGNRAVLGLVLGAIGGFVAGGAIGAAVSSDSCRCSNPELHGFAIGAPIGAVVGGFLGYALASR
jgi:hypothetical protein